jgi:proteasome lid subunit RPN8/RPN11
MLKIPRHLIGATVDVLREATFVERVVLWLGRRESGGVVVHEVFVPIQETEADYFRIPPHGMSALTDHLHARRLMVAAQVHTHPGDAFHSAADDRWAILRHAGALSFVIARFCQETAAATFEADAHVYRLTKTIGSSFLSPRRPTRLRLDHGARREREHAGGRTRAERGAGRRGSRRHSIPTGAAWRSSP